MINPIPYEQLTPELAAKGCFVTGMPNSDYHAHDSVSKSALDLIDRSPAHLMYGVKREQTRAMVIGSAIHSAILEPELFKDEYLLLTQVKDRRASEYKEAIKHHSADNVLVSTEANNVAGMQESVLSNPEVAELLALEGWSELSAFVQCPETGLILRCRYDRLTKCGQAIDLKKTQDARASEFSKSIANYRYHVQDAHYSRVFELITGVPVHEFKFIAIEEKPPHAAAVYFLDDISREQGKRDLMANLHTYAECKRSNDWHSYQNESGMVGLPVWAQEDLDEELSL